MYEAWFASTAEPVLTVPPNLPRASSREGRNIGSIHKVHVRSDILLVAFAQHVTEILELPGTCNGTCILRHGEHR